METNKNNPSKKDLDLLMTYGEYNIPFEIARTMDCYHYTVNQYDCLEQYRLLFNDYSDGDEYFGGEEVLEVGNIDIELNVTQRGYEGEKNLLDFYVCVREELQIYPNGVDNSDNDGWISHDFSEYEVKFEDLKDATTLEKVMYEELMRYAEANNLYWSKRN